MLRGIFISRRNQLFISRRKAFVIDLSQMALISQIIIASGEGSQSKYLRHLRYLRATHISVCIIYLSQIPLISQIIIASGEGSQSKDLRHLRNLRDNNFSACNTISRRWR